MPEIWTLVALLVIPGKLGDSYSPPKSTPKSRAIKLLECINEMVSKWQILSINRVSILLAWA